MFVGEPCGRTQHSLSAVMIGLEMPCHIFDPCYPAGVRSKPPSRCFGGAVTKLVPCLAPFRSASAGSWRLARRVGGRETEH